MDFKAEELGDVRVVRITGNLDTQTSTVAQEQLLQLIDDGATKVLVDFEDLNYISSSGLRMLLVAVKRLGANGGQLRVCSANKTVQEVFEISGFGDILSTFGSKAEALDGF
jgi:anti-anti-sigma factor